MTSLNPPQGAHKASIKADRNGLLLCLVLPVAAILASLIAAPLFVLALPSTTLLLVLASLSLLALAR